jgi:DNA helicase IV
MNLASGVFRSLLSISWSLSCSPECIRCKIGSAPRLTIQYIDLDSITQHSSIFSEKLVLQSDGATHEFKGISAGECTRFIKEVEEYASSSIAERIEYDLDTCTYAMKQFNQIANGELYISNSKIDEAKKSIPALVRRLFENRFLNIDSINPKLKSFAHSYQEFIDPNSAFIEQLNDSYVKRKKTQYASFFDSIERYPLTDEQRTAVVTQEDNVLLVAAAGSGKSSTLVGKILYLLKEGLHQPNQIIVLAYNKDAQLDLTTRIDAQFNRLKWLGERVPARTFHGFCMDVISAVRNEKPKISSIALGSKSQQLRYFIDLVEGLKRTNLKFSMDLLKYYSIFKFPSPSDQDIESQEDYETYIKRLEGLGDFDKKAGKWREVLRSMNGIEVKSLEELSIANWLYLQGINFKYEQRYAHATAEKDHGQYHPDFYYPDVDIWHEHFGINAYGRAPKFMVNYEKSVEWKRDTHKEKGTQLIETHSAHFKDRTVFKRLDSLLSEANVPRNPPSQGDINGLVARVFNPPRDLELVMTFLKHFKTNNLTLGDLEERAESHSDGLREEAFLNVFRPIYEVYQSELQRDGEIDFEDLIHTACEYIEEGKFDSAVDYMMVDELQDVSQDRVRLIKAMAAQRKHMKLFGVGDDWQSIYRFSGADLRVMTRFSDIFGYTKSLDLTETFRSVQQIVDVASEFIQRNPGQFQKKVSALKSSDRDPIICRPYQASRPDHILDELLTTLNTRHRSKKENCSVFILTRYTFQRPSNLSKLIESNPSLEVQWKTVHGSKGLEADYVIVHHLNGGNYGFPSEISNDPLLDMVIPEPEEFPDAEERRLFYVALTRARRAVFCFYDPEKPSRFIEELSGISGVKADKADIDRYNPVLEAGTTCPVCKTSNMEPRRGKNGPFLGCNSYPKCMYTADIRCTSCKLGVIVERKARDTGNVFYACNQYPKCDHLYEPLNNLGNRDSIRKVRTKRNFRRR